MTAVSEEEMSARYTRVATDLGEITLVAEGEALTGVYFPRHWTRPSKESFGRYVEVDDDPLLRRARFELEDYLAGRRTTFDLPTRAAGDEFQHRVWALLARIPYGTTTTYGALAEQLGDPTLARDVGHAVGHNPLSILVPCHRVVGKDGRLTGYAGGLQRKQRLLDLEEPVDVQASRLF
jgi:methylated-DNA-[protein]-cysteine S-methyltransferase